MSLGGPQQVIGERYSGVLPLCPPPLPAHRWSFGSFLGKLGDSWWGGMAVGKDAPNPPLRCACNARTKSGTADHGETVQPCVLCGLTASCLHLGTSALLTLYFVFFFFPPNFPSQRHVLPTCPGLGCVPPAPGSRSAAPAGSDHRGN